MSSENNRRAAFAVHLLTASGALWAFAALLAAAQRDWTAMFLWLGLALAVDGIDGTLARRFQVNKVLPRWSGDTLDLIIDYATYVFIPAFALVWSLILPLWLGVICAAVIVVTGAFYFADREMKTPDKSFQGFPGCWNFFAFVIFVVEPAHLVTALGVLLLGLFTFLPLKFIHPVRTRTLRPLNIALTVAWSVLAFYAVMHELSPPDWAVAGLVSATVYLFGIGFVLQAREKLEKIRGH